MAVMTVDRKRLVEVVRSKEKGPVAASSRVGLRLVSKTNRLTSSPAFSIPSEPGQQFASM